MISTSCPTMATIAQSLAVMPAMPTMICKIRAHGQLIGQSCHSKSILGRAATASLSFYFHQDSLFSSHVGSQLTCIHSFSSMSMYSDVCLCASTRKFAIILSGCVRIHFRGDNCDLWQLQSWLYQLLITHAILLEWWCAMFVNYCYSKKPQPHAHPQLRTDKIIRRDSLVILKRFHLIFWFAY